MSVFDTLLGMFKPKIPTADIPTPEEIARLAAQGSVAWADGSVISGPKYNPDDLIGRKGYTIYKRMMHDEQVKAVVQFKRASITGRDWFFELDHMDVGLSQTEAERRVLLCTEMLKSFSGSFTDGLNTIMMAQWQGFSMTEQMFALFEHDGKSYWGLKNLRAKPFDTFQPVTDDMGDVQHWLQASGGIGREQIIDLNKFVYYRYNPEMDEHFGWSELRAAYRAWIGKGQALDFFNYYLEKLAGGFVTVQAKEGQTLIRGTPAWNDVVGLLTNLTGKSSVILPSTVDMDVVTTSGSQVASFETALEIHDLAIAKALLVPNLLGLSHTGQTGAFSQSETHFEVFLIMVDSEADRLEETLNEQIFQRLALANFADGITPRFRFKPLSDRKKMQIIKTWSEMVTSGAVEATDTDEAHVRDIMEFPEKGDPINEPAPTAPAAQPGTTVPGQEDEPNQPIGKGDPDPETINETILGTRAIVSASAFARAEARVAFAVIDRQAETRVTEFSGKIEDAVADMVAEGVARIEEEALGQSDATADKIGRFDLNGFKLRTVNTQITRMLQASFNIGEDHSRREIDLAKGSQFSKHFDANRLGDLAAEFIKQKAFTISGDMKSSVVKVIKTELANGLKFGRSQREITRAIYKSLVNRGILSGQTAATALGIGDIAALAEELALKGGLTAHLLSTVIRTNGFEALNEARFNNFTDPSLDGFIRALQYSAILDSRTTTICSHLDNRVYETDSDLWNSYRPPNHFNCRSLLVPVTLVDEEVEITANPPTISPQEGFG